MPRAKLAYSPYSPLARMYRRSSGSTVEGTIQDKGIIGSNHDLPLPLNQMGPKVEAEWDVRTTVLLYRVLGTTPAATTSSEYTVHPLLQ